MLRPLWVGRVGHSGLGHATRLGLATMTALVFVAGVSLATSTEEESAGRPLAGGDRGPLRVRGTLPAADAVGHPNLVQSERSFWSPAAPGSSRPRLGDGWSAGLGGVALVLAVCGGLAAAAQRLLPRAASGDVRVVGRVSLSPKHTVYLIRVGGRTLLVGAGPQGAPVLISELSDSSAAELTQRQEVGE
jgi:hypothetical protein